MSKYLESLNKEVRQYFKILSKEFPEWLIDYIETNEMQRIDKISISCGTDYTKLFNIKYWYSNLDHSVGVALIIWHFTQDKTQTLAGLFHDIATPTFKHCIDFMNGDSEKQESTEERTESIIKNSKQIMYLLNRDGIDVEKVIDYHMYPIADNDTPKLSADRFEYTFSSGMSFYRIWELEDIEKIYNNVSILKNEEGIVELGFNDIDICQQYINNISRIWPQWIGPKDRITMQFLADIVKSMNISGYITIEDLYQLSEKEILDKILNCEDNYLREVFIKFQNAEICFESKEYIDNKYCINVKGKKRYINPLVKYDNKVERISYISKQANECIRQFLNINQDSYLSFDFDFVPYEHPKTKKINY